MPRVGKAAAAPAALPSQTLVVDNGGFSLKAGLFVGENDSDENLLSKCHNIPNTLVRTRDRKTYIGVQADKDISQWSEAVFRRPVEHGQIVSWEAQKEIWDHSIFDGKTASSDLLVRDAAETTLVLGENPSVLPALQKNADEIIMEEWGFGGYLRKNGEPEDLRTPQRG
jgi:actin-related protein 6